MIGWGDLYTVLSAVVPLYVAMGVAYGSVRWWKVFTPVQCGGINRFVAVYAVPLLSFHFISTNDPYKMNGRFILADTVAKLALLLLLFLWVRLSAAGAAASLDWLITIFALSSLPNTLVMGIPMLSAMYGTNYGALMIQLVVLQCIVWYTLLLFLFEFRAAAALLRRHFPNSAAAIVSVRVDADVASLDGRDHALLTFADVSEDGRIRVTVRRSASSPARISAAAAGVDASSKAITPRASNLTGAEIYSVYSSRNNTPRECCYGGAANAAAGWDGGAANMMNFSSNRPSNFTCSDVYSVQSSRGPTPRASNANNDDRSPHFSALKPPPHFGVSAKKLADDCLADGGSSIIHINGGACGGGGGGGADYYLKPVETAAAAAAANGDLHEALTSAAAAAQYMNGGGGGEDFSFGSKGRFPVAEAEKQRQSISNRSSTGLHSPPPGKNPVAPPPLAGLPPVAAAELPAAPVLAKLILRMVGRKLLQNPNTYSSLLGLIWSLIAFRWDIAMPKIISNSISLVSDAGLGMAMFSLGLFMAMQPRLIACGTTLAVFAMAIRFLIGPAVMAAASIAVGLRGVDLHAAIVQAALPQGIVPFVFAREYDLHPDILSTAVIFGMLVALPTTILYYVLLGL